MTRLFVGQIPCGTPFDIVHEKLLHVFRFFGDIEELEILTRKGRSTGIAFVSFRDPCDAETALSLSHDRVQIFDTDKCLQVEWSVDRGGKTLRRNRAKKETAQFFVCLAENEKKLNYFNGKYRVFGALVSGRDVLKKIEEYGQADGNCRLIKREQSQRVKQVLLSDKGGGPPLWCQMFRLPRPSPNPSTSSASAPFGQG